mgnify:CR=1 FL=1
MKTLFKTFRFIIIAFVATAISFGTIVTTTYAKDHKAGGSKAGSHQSSSNNKGDKASKGSNKNKGDKASKGSNKNKGDKAFKGGKNKEGDKNTAKSSRAAVGAISAGSDPVSFSKKGQRPSRSAQFISRFDQNGDAQVTLAEIQTASQTKFRSLDVDSNGSISNAELTTANTIAVGDRVTKVISKEDSDGDGNITTTEAYQLVNRVVASGADADSNGVISSAELTAHYTKLQTNAQLGVLDTNTDGNISGAEYAITASNQFTKLDVDSDGIVGN